MKLIKAVKSNSLNKVKHALAGEHYNINEIFCPQKEGEFIYTDDTPLHFAVRNEARINILKLLLKTKGRDINRKNFHGQTALMLAAIHHNRKAVKLLLDEPDILINKKNSFHKTAYDTAIRWKDFDIANLIKNKKRGIEHGNK